MELGFALSTSHAPDIYINQELCHRMLNSIKVTVEIVLLWTIPFYALWQRVQTWPQIYGTKVTNIDDI
jgi:hypothetical protein